MKYGSWCYCCYNLVCAVSGNDLNKCKGCKRNPNNHLKRGKEYDSNNHRESDKKERNG